MDYENFCEELRARCGACCLPVDLGMICRRLKITVVERSLEGLPHAISVARPKLIILNSRRPKLSRRFDLAHELWHFLFEEKYHSDHANKFASTLLMPKVAWSQLTVVSKDARKLSEIFEVSLQMVFLRTEQLRGLD